MADLLVQTSAGRVVGFLDTFALRESSAAPLIEAGQDGGLPAVQKWLGVPYAQARRWERPQPPQAWSEPLKAHEFGSMFHQPPSGTEKIYGHQKGVYKRSFVTQSEDSFNLNVFAPEGTKEGDSLPVLFWVYGGSLNNGSADKFIYDPTEWIRSSQAEGQKFIVVSGNYRTNIFGFFSNPDVLAADPDGLAGNYGLYDVIAMLEWVQSNIRAFGGNPENVTLFGQSAGAFIISNLLVTGKKLFTKAIMQSGAAGTMLIKPPNESYPAASHILNFYGPGGATPEARLNALRSVSAEAIHKAHNDSYRWGGVNLTLEEGPKAIWTKATIERLEAGEWDEWIERVIIGTTEDEGTIFTLGNSFNSATAFEAHLSHFPSRLHSSLRAKYLAPFNGVHPPQTSLIDAPMSRLLADHLFVDPAWDMAKALAGTENRKSGKKAKVWMYRCKAEVDRISRGPVKCGAMHIIEIPFVFNSSSLWEEGSQEAASANAFGKAWANFAISGNPDPNWQPFTPASPSWLVFEDGGKTENESLAGFEEGMIDWADRGKGKTGDEGEGDLLGETNE
ncbi:Alpha/Beta hydrolase protein [Leucosporidium creatinivorum]|uniref:Carboxylic ester hydrolase n=1 Tax=Leucosporidium creatinivorum TaxID=106004 RepID=A0A1Y2FG94_9BASI|nr:Alpha/Beta hydrolase protein [Leucosporidium creatinivorum]